jgi:hypothetical protein
MYSTTTIEKEADSALTRTAYTLGDMRWALATNVKQLK